MRPFRYYFAQREAVESAIWLYEVEEARDPYALIKFDSSERVSKGMFDEDWTRYVMKLATGAGKTKVMSRATMIVADANLLAYLHVPSGLSAAAEAVFDHDSEWVAPALWRSEFRSALLGLIRQGAFTVEVAREIAHRAELWMDGREYPVNTNLVLELAQASGCSSYDCEYVSVAQHLDVPLITADRQILKAFPSTAIHPGKFSA